MTLWERVEELTRRVGELEERIPKRPPVVQEMATQGGGGLEFNTPPICGACGERHRHGENMLCPIAIQASIPPNPPHIQAIERGLVPPPPSYEARMLDEACAILELIDPCWPPSKQLIDRRDSFLARARVALEKP